MNTYLPTRTLHAALARARRAMTPTFLALCLLLACASCEASDERNVKDGLGRPWKLKANYDTSNKHLTISATIGDEIGDKLTIVQYNENGNQCAVTITSTTGEWSGTLASNATSITILCDAGTAGVAVHESLAE